MEIRAYVQKEWDGLSLGLGLEQTWVGHNLFGPTLPFDSYEQFVPLIVYG